MIETVDSFKDAFSLQDYNKFYFFEVQQTLNAY